MKQALLLGILAVACTEHVSVPRLDDGSVDTADDSSDTSVVEDTDTADDSSDTSVVEDTARVDSSDVAPAPCTDPTLPSPWIDLGRPNPITHGRLWTSGDAILFGSRDGVVRWSSCRWVDMPLSAKTRQEAFSGNPAPSVVRDPRGGFLAYAQFGAVSSSDGKSRWVDAGSTVWWELEALSASGAAFGWVRESAPERFERADSLAAAPEVVTSVPKGVAPIHVAGTRVLVGDAFSTDDGKTFAPLPAAPLSSVSHRALTTGSVCALGYGIARYDDAGWTVTESGFVSATGEDMWDAVGDRVYAFGKTSAGARLAFSADGCKTWSFFEVPSAAITQIAITSSGLALTDGTTIWASSDEAKTFVALPSPRLALTFSLAGRETSAGLELVTASPYDRGAIFRSVAGGAWVRSPGPVELGFPCPGDCVFPYFDVWIDPKRGTVFRFTESNRMYAFVGGTWVYQNDRGPMAFSGDRIAGSWKYSTDGAMTWSAYTLGTDQTLLGIDATGTAWMQPNTGSFPIMKSTDLVTWTTTGSGQAICVSPAGILYGFDGSKGTSRSNDGGKTWTVIPGYGPLCNDLLWTATANGVRLSYDGVTSEEFSGLPGPPAYVTAIAGRVIVNVDAVPSHAGGLYMVTPTLPKK